MSTTPQISHESLKAVMTFKIWDVQGNCWWKYGTKSAWTSLQSASVSITNSLKYKGNWNQPSEAERAEEMNNIRSQYLIVPCLPVAQACFSASERPSLNTVAKRVFEHLQVQAESSSVIIDS